MSTKMSLAWTWPGNLTAARKPSGPSQSATVSWVAAAAAAFVAAFRVQLLQLGSTILELLGATYLSMRYFTGDWQIAFGCNYSPQPPNNLHTDAAAIRT
jgi:hypothetical protein